MDTSRYLPFTKNWVSPLRAAFYFKLNEKLPRFGFSLSILVAMFGILFLWMFPLVLITLPFQFYDTAVHAKELESWIYALIQFLLIALSGTFSWAMYKLRFSLPTGLDVTKEKFPHLVGLIEEIGGVRLERTYDLDAPKGVAGRNSDNTFIRQVLNWEPDTPLRNSFNQN